MGEWHGALALVWSCLGSSTAPLGKVSFGPEKILGNLKALLEAVQRLKPSAAKGQYMVSMAISTTMGAGFKVDMTQIKKFIEG